MKSFRQLLAKQSTKFKLSTSRAFVTRAAHSGVSGKPEVTLYYWPLANRGNLVRYLLTESDIDYEWVHDTSKIVNFARPYGRTLGPDNTDFPVRAPPCVAYKGRTIGQLPVVCNWICSLNPALLPSDASHKLQSQMVVHNANDILANSNVKDCAKMDDEAFHDYYLKEGGAFDGWLRLLSDGLQYDSTSDVFHFDGRCTLPDFAVFWILEGYECLFNFDSTDRWSEFLGGRYPALLALQRVMEARPSIEKARKELRDEGVVDWWPTRVPVINEGIRNFESKITKFVVMQ